MLVALASLFIWCFTIFSGCSKCFKEFPRASFGDKPDFSGFDRESWEPRSNKDHQAAAEKVRQAKTPSDAQKFASSSGACYSVLFQLPYYYAIRFALIDPMFNLLLGSAKHVLKTWIALKGVIPSGHYGTWRAFVHACQLLCKKVITKQECMEADQKLMRFCVMFRSPLREGEVHTKHASSWPF